MLWNLDKTKSLENKQTNNKVMDVHRKVQGLVLSSCEQFVGMCNVNWCGQRGMKRPQINTFKSIEPKEDETERSSSGTVETRHDNFDFVGQNKSI